MAMNKVRDSAPHIGVFGAGAVGAYLGVRLSSAGYRVTLVGRAQLVERVGQLQAIDLNGESCGPGPRLSATVEPGALAECDICLVSVKCGDTEAAGAALARILAPEALVISFQNGLGNAERLRRAGLTAQRVLAGVVSFNVRRDDTRLSKATDGPLLVEGPDPARAQVLRRVFADARETLELRADLLGVQANKLLLNLNNGLCALTGVSVARSLASSDLRWCFATCMREGIEVMRAAGIPIVRVGRIYPPLVARLLNLPDFIVDRVVQFFRRVDDDARSSTLQDIDAGKKTEIDYLNGEIVNLARAAGRDAPANRFVVDRVHELENQRPPRFLTPEMVRAGIRAPG